mmetsp:Transcript_32304/g.46894  ORF Transcript_32304/g.46894 Transcript_32304/m.46894 type:complete len:81 (+) Transcript_32304:660-902(+)
MKHTSSIQTVMNKTSYIHTSKQACGAHAASIIMEDDDERIPHLISSPKARACCLYHNAICHHCWRALYGVAIAVYDLNII